MRLSVINEQVKNGKYKLPSGQGEISFTFRPGVFTSEFLDKLTKTDTTSKATAGMLASALVSTDLTDDNDNPLVITGDVLYKTVPFSIVIGLIGAMQEANSPPKKSKMSSSGSFSAEESDDE